MRAREGRSEATLADLVVLALLSERPMHGYEVWRELVRREVEDWAGVSRAQVYYSLAKLRENEWVREVAGAGPAGGPERQVVALTRRGRAAAARALARDEWATQRPPPPFLTWLCLSHLVGPEVIAQGLERRRTFLVRERDKEVATLEAIRADQGPMIPTAELIVELAIRQFELELRWLDEVQEKLVP